MTRTWCYTTAECEQYMVDVVGDSNGEGPFYEVQGPFTLPDLLGLVGRLARDERDVAPEDLRTVDGLLAALTSGVGWKRRDVRDEDEVGP